MKVIIVEDNDFKFDIVSDYVRDIYENVEIEWYTDVTSFLKVLKETEDFSKTYDLAILDNYLPIDNETTQRNAFAANMVKEIKDLGLSIPIIINSSDELNEDETNYLTLFDDVKILTNQRGFNFRQFKDFYNELVSKNRSKSRN